MLNKRIASERERLGLSLAEFAKKVGVHRNTQARYESGERTPDTDYLGRLHDIGVDVPYVMTGKRKSAAESLEEEFDDLGRAFSTALGLSEGDLLLACADVHKAIKGLAPDDRNFDATFPEYEKQVRSEYAKAAELLLAKSPKLARQSSAAKDANLALLTEVIEGIEQAISKLRKSISPAKKAMAIVMLYRMGMTSDKIDRKMIEDAVRLAASS